MMIMIIIIIIIMRTCMLIDVAITGDRNVIKKEAEKILKYEGWNYNNGNYLFPTDTK